MIILQVNLLLLIDFLNINVYVFIYLETSDSFTIVIMYNYRKFYKTTPLMVILSVK